MEPEVGFEPTCPFGTALRMRWSQPLSHSGNYMGGAAGFEPALSASTVLCLNHSAKRPVYVTNIVKITYKTKPRR